MILLGKSRSQIKEDFCYRHRISEQELEQYMRNMKKIYIHPDVIKITVGILSILLGISFIIALIWSLSNNEAVFVFKEAHGIIQRFVNIFVIALEFVVPLLAVILPWIYWKNEFDWN